MFKPFRYQQDTYEAMVVAAKKYGTICLFDETGLGKTVTSSFAAKQLCQKSIAVIAPGDNKIDWESTLDAFDVPYQIVGRNSANELADFDVLIIDEAHNFSKASNECNQRLFRRILELQNTPYCILLTATPFNNSISEFFDMLACVPFKKNTIISYMLAPIRMDLEEAEEAIRKSERFESDTYKNISITTKNRLKMSAGLRNLETLLQLFCFRNTRTGIAKAYPDDIALMGAFPKLHTVDIEYEKEQNVHNADVLVKYINSAPLVRQKLSYWASGRDELGLAGVYRTFLLKRYESSAIALLETLQRNLNSLVEMTKFEGSSEFMYDGKSFKPFSATRFWDSVRKDIAIFKELVEQVSLDSDNWKIEAMLEVAKKHKKLVIFTEYEDTQGLICDALEANGIKTIRYSGKTNKKELTIIKNEFDANLAKKHQTNNFQVLVCTDVLSEGINLHRANGLINWDNKWNPSRTTQRNGRVNRIYRDGGQNEVFIYNFRVPINIENSLKLESKIDDKLSLNRCLKFSHKPFLHGNKASFTIEGVNQYQLANKDGNGKVENSNPFFLIDNGNEHILVNLNYNSSENVIHGDLDELESYIIQELKSNHISWPFSGYSSEYNQKARTKRTYFHAYLDAIKKLKIGEDKDKINHYQLTMMSDQKNSIHTEYIWRYCEDMKKEFERSTPNMSHNENVLLSQLGYNPQNDDETKQAKHEHWRNFLLNVLVIMGKYNKHYNQTAEKISLLTF